MNESYHVDNYHVVSNLHVSSQHERGVVRGPGEIQATVVVENIMELVAAKVNLPSDLVREKNFYPREIGDIATFHGLPLAPSFALYEVWENAKSSIT